MSWFPDSSKVNTVGCTSLRITDIQGHFDGCAVLFASIVLPVTGRLCGLILDVAILRDIALEPWIRTPYIIEAVKEKGR